MFGFGISILNLYLSKWLKRIEVCKIRGFDIQFYLQPMKIRALTSFVFMARLMLKVDSGISNTKSEFLFYILKHIYF